MAESENLQDTPKDELLRQIEEAGQVVEQAEEKPVVEEEVKEEVKEEQPAPEVVEGQAEKEAEPQEGLIMGKFKTEEARLTAHQELEKKHTRDAQRLSKYKDFMEPYVEFDAEGNVIGLKPEVTQPPKPEIPRGQSQDEVVGMLEQRYNVLEQQHGPVKAQIILNSEISNAIMQDKLSKALTPVDEIKAERAVDSQKSKIRASKPDFGNFESEVDTILKGMDVKSKTSPRAVETAYYIVKGRKSEELLKVKEEEIRAKATAIENQKQKAQVEHQTKTPEEPEPDIDSLSAADMAKAVGLKKIERY